jgi:hypothetical protein
MVGIPMLEPYPTLTHFIPPIFYRNQAEALAASEGHHHQQSHEQNSYIYGGRALRRGTRRRGGDMEQVDPWDFSP